MRTRSRRFAHCMMTALCAVLLGISLNARQQPGPPAKPEAQVKAIALLDYMVGEWSGEGWMDVGGRRVTFRGTEAVERKLDGTVLLVEGNFLAKPAGAVTEVPVHTTLGVISFNPQTGRYRFTTWLASGSSGERELTLLPQGWQWEIKSPAGVVRYIMRLTERGEWLETGERSSDGAAWQQFFEMRLRKGH
jgi:hypothetical protein